MANSKSVECPACSGALEISRSVFRSDFRCPHCGAALEVSVLYTRFIVLLSLILACPPAWEIGILGPRSCFFGIPWGFYLFWLPLGFLILTVLVRIAPSLVRPTLVVRRPHHFMALNLTSG